MMYNITTVEQVRKCFQSPSFHSYLNLGLMLDLTLGSRERFQESATRKQTTHEQSLLGRFEVAQHTLVHTSQTPISKLYQCKRVGEGGQENCQSGRLSSAQNALVPCVSHIEWYHRSGCIW
jgi:hypothetical protein